MRAEHTERSMWDLSAGPSLAAGLDRMSSMGWVLVTTYEKYDSTFASRGPGGTHVTMFIFRKETPP